MDVYIVSRVETLEMSATPGCLFALWNAFFSMAWNRHRSGTVSY